MAHYINWKQWWPSISDRTWKEANPARRLELAKEDLRMAGLSAEKVTDLTPGQLGSAWTHVPKDQKKMYRELRPESRRRKAGNVLHIQQYHA